MASANPVSGASSTIIAVHQAAAGRRPAALIEGRILGDKLHRRLGQPIVIDNRGGAGEVLDTELAAKATPAASELKLALPAAEGPSERLARHRRRRIVPRDVLLEYRNYRNAHPPSQAKPSRG
jgi:hypothetical protein